MGSFVADAASMSLHWIYNPDAIEQMLASAGVRSSPEFFDPPSCPWYDLPLGSLSPYGDESLVLLQSMVQHGELKPMAFINDSYSFFKAYSGRLNSVMSSFVLNVERGCSARGRKACAVRDNEAHALVKVPVLVARYAGTGLLEQAVEQAGQVHQDSTEAVGAAIAAALLLEHIVLGSTVNDALAWARRNLASAERELLDKALRLNSTGTVDATRLLGSSCHLPGSFLSPLHCIARHPFDYKAAVRANILAAGDQCSRAVFVGACLAAAMEQGQGDGGGDGSGDGGDSDSDDDAGWEQWGARVTRMPELTHLIDELVHGHAAAEL
jgi:hypothetical protein